jgi:hypothetical protein
VPGERTGSVVSEIDSDLGAEHRRVRLIVTAARPEDVLEVGREVDPRRQLEAVICLDDSPEAPVRRSSLSLP